MPDHVLWIVIIKVTKISKQTVLYMVCGQQYYMLTTTLYKSNLVVVHGLCSIVQDLGKW